MSIEGDINHSVKYVDFDRLFQPHAFVRTRGCSRNGVVLGEPWCVSYDGRMTMTRGYPVEEISLRDDECEMMMTIRYMRSGHS